MDVNIAFLVFVLKGAFDRELDELRGSAQYFFLCGFAQYLKCTCLICNTICFFDGSKNCAKTAQQVRGGSGACMACGERACACGWDGPVKVVCGNSTGKLTFHDSMGARYDSTNSDHDGN